MSVDLPDRVIVDQHGHYWRDYGAFHSMCPVSDENTRTEVAAVYVRAVRRESRDGSGPARWVASGDVECAHDHATCDACGEGLTGLPETRRSAP